MSSCPAPVGLTEPFLQHNFCIKPFACTQKTPKETQVTSITAVYSYIGFGVCKIINYNSALQASQWQVPQQNIFCINIFRDQTRTTALPYPYSIQKISLTIRRKDHCSNVTSHCIKWNINRFMDSTRPLGYQQDLKFTSHLIHFCNVSLAHVCCCCYYCCCRLWEFSSSDSDSSWHWRPERLVGGAKKRQRFRSLPNWQVATPTTSALSKRVFSIAGLAISAKRVSLVPTIVSEIIFIHENASVCKYDNWRKIAWKTLSFFPRV